MKEPAGLDFTAVLASAIHDMKNSLGMVLNSLEHIIDRENGQCHCTTEQAGQLQYEAKRVNDNLVQLLTLYRMQATRYRPHVEEYAVADFLEECYLLNQPLLEHRGVGMTIDCDPDLIWYFDRDLMSGVINNVTHNALRYTRDRLHVVAREQAGYLVVSVEDNGEGFPEAMLTGEDLQRDLDFQSGRTGLGLYFCALVAHMHENAGREGYIRLSNETERGGARFSIFLP